MMGDNMTTTMRKRGRRLLLLGVLVVCAAAPLMSAQAWGGTKSEDGWEYYPVTKTFEYREQQPIGNKDGAIT